MEKKSRQKAPMEIKDAKKSGLDRPLKKAEEKQLEIEMEDFMMELEENPDMRMSVNLYKKNTVLASKKNPETSEIKEEKLKTEKKVKSKLAKKVEKQKAKTKGKASSTTPSEASETGEESGDELPEIPIEELIDELAEGMGGMSTASKEDEISLIPKSELEETTPITFT